MELEINRVTLLGRLAADAEIHEIQGKSLTVTRFMVITSREVSNDLQFPTMEKKAQCTYCKFFGREIISGYLRKGCRVYIEGYLNTMAYKVEGDTRKRYSTEVVVRSIGLLNRDDAELHFDLDKYDKKRVLAAFTESKGFESKDRKWEK